MLLHITSPPTAVTFHHHHKRMLLQVTELRTDLVLKARCQQEVQTAFHHKTATRSATETLCSFQVEVDVLHHTRCVGTMGTMFSSTQGRGFAAFRCSIWLVLLFFPRKEEPFKSWHCHLSSKPSHYAKKDKKGKGWQGSHRPWLLTSGLGRQRTLELQPCFFNKKLQIEHQSVWEQQYPAAERSRQHHSLFNKPKQRQHRKPLPASLPLLCFQPRNSSGETCGFLSTDQLK